MGSSGAGKGKGRYCVCVQIGGEWRCLATVEAADQPHAVRTAFGLLKPEHYDKPLWVVDEQTYREHIAGKKGSGAEGGDGKR